MKILDCDFIYDYGWRSNLVVFWQHKKISIQLSFDCDRDIDGITELQLTVFSNFKLAQVAFLNLAEIEISKQLTARSAQLEIDATQLTSIFFSRDRFPEGREFCLLFDSPLEPELGLAI